MCRKYFGPFGRSSSRWSAGEGSCHCSRSCSESFVMPSLARESHEKWSLKDLQVGSISMSNRCICQIKQRLQTCGVCNYNTKRRGESSRVEWSGVESSRVELHAPNMTNNNCHCHIQQAASSSISRTADELTAFWFRCTLQVARCPLPVASCQLQFIRPPDHFGMRVRRFWPSLWAVSVVQHNLNPLVSFID